MFGGMKSEEREKRTEPGGVHHSTYLELARISTRPAAPAVSPIKQFIFDRRIVDCLRRQVHPVRHN